MLGPLTYGALRSGGARAAWTPASVGTLQLWLENCPAYLYQDENGQTAVSSDADPVGCWLDIGGSNNFSQATSDRKPLYKTGVISTKPAIRWDGSNDRLDSDSPATTWKFLHDGSDWVISFVAKTRLESPDAFYYLFGTTVTNMTEHGIWIGYDNRASASAVQRLRLAVLKGSAGNPVVNLEVDNTWPGGEWVAITITHINGATGDDYEVYLNGVKTAGLEPSGAHSSSDPSRDMLIGNRGATSGEYDGDLASLIIWSGSDAKDKLTQIHEYQEAVKEGANACDYGFEGIWPRFSLSQIDRSADLGTANIQGVAYDGTHYYTTASNTVYKWSRDSETNAYSQVTSSDLSSAIPASATQINGMNIYDGYLWIGANNYATEPRLGWVIQVDLSDLSHVANHEVDAHWCEGGAWHDVGDGDEYWAVFHDWDRVSRYKFVESVWTKVDDYLLPLIAGKSVNLYQGAAWYGGAFLITQLHNNDDDTATHFHEWNGSGFTGRQVIPAFDPTVGQGIHWEATGSVLLFSERDPGGNGQTIIRATFTDDEA